MSYGTLVINEHAIPITGIALRGGKVLVTASMRVTERLHLPHGAEFRVHGPDGVLVVTGFFRNHGEDLEVKPGRDHDLTVIQPLGMLDKAAVGWPA